MGDEGVVESWIVEAGRRFESKSSLSMLPVLTLRLELREGMVGEHRHLECWTELQWTEQTR